MHCWDSPPSHARLSPRKSNKDNPKLNHLEARWLYRLNTGRPTVFREPMVVYAVDTRNTPFLHVVAPPTAKGSATSKKKEALLYCVRTVQFSNTRHSAGPRLHRPASGRRLCRGWCNIVRRRPPGWCWRLVQGLGCGGLGFLWGGGFGDGLQPAADHLSRRAHLRLRKGVVQQQHMAGPVVGLLLEA